MKEIKFAYKPKASTFILVIIFFSICAFVLTQKALNNDRGLILNGIIEFSQNGASIFYWSLVGASGIFVLLGVVILFKGLLSNQEIVLTEKSISSPKSGFNSKIITINYTEIKDVSIQSVQNQRFLNISHSGGKLSIPNNMLSNTQAFNELVSMLEEKTEIARNKQ